MERFDFIRKFILNNTTNSSIGINLRGQVLLAEFDELKRLASRTEKLELDAELSYHANVNLIKELEEVKGTRDYYIRKYKKLKEIENETRT